MVIDGVGGVVFLRSKCGLLLLPLVVVALVISLGDVSVNVLDASNDNNPDCSLINELSRSISGLDVNRLRCCCC